MWRKFCKKVKRAGVGVGFVVVGRDWAFATKV